MTSIYAFLRDVGLQKDIPRDALPALLEREDAIVWIDISQPDDDDTDLLAETFHFHPLALEDCILDRPHPKVDEYPGYLYLVVHGVSVGTEAEPGGVATKELDVFLGARYLVTFHYEDLRSLDETRTAVEKNPDLLARGPAFLLSRLLDFLVDRYLTVMEDLDGRIDALEERAQRETSQQVIGEIFALRRSVLRIRRLAAKQREVLARFARQEFPLVDAATSMYFRSVYDHLARIADLAESYRELLSSIMETFLTNNSNRLNAIMKTLTLVNTIFLPLTFVTGIYGMNFDRLPGKDVPYGFWIAIGCMALVALVMVLLYRRKRWM